MPGRVTAPAAMPGRVTVPYSTSGSDKQEDAAATVPASVEEADAARFAGNDSLDVENVAAAFYMEMSDGLYVDDMLMGE